MLPYLFAHQPEAGLLQGLRERIQQEVEAAERFNGNAVRSAGSVSRRVPRSGKTSREEEIPREALWDGGMTHVMLGDTRSKSNCERLQEWGWGRMFTERTATPYLGEKYGFDNGAFKCWRDGLPFDEARFLRRVEAARGLPPPTVAVVPDVVAGGCGSLAFSLAWRQRLHDDWPWYLAVQDGMTIHDVKPHIDRFAGIFLGGSDALKVQAWRWRVFARDHGKPFHYARAGSIPRLESAIKMRADSIDTTYPLWEDSKFRYFRKMYEYLTVSPRPQFPFMDDADENVPAGTFSELKVSE